MQGRFDAQGVSFANAQKLGHHYLDAFRWVRKRLHAGLLEALDRDGMVRQAWRIERWPVTIGRALDNDVVLTEPHVAAHHATIDLRRRRPTARRRRSLVGPPVRPATASASGASASPAAPRDRWPTTAATSTCTSAARRCACACRAMRWRPSWRWRRSLVARDPLAADPRPGAGRRSPSCSLNTYIDNDPDGLGREIGKRRPRRPAGRGAVVRLLGAAVEDLRPAEQLRLARARVRHRQPGVRRPRRRCRRCSPSPSPGRGSPTSPSSSSSPRWRRRSTSTCWRSSRAASG